MEDNKTGLDKNLEALERLAAQNPKQLVQFRQEPQTLNRNFIYSNEILTAAWLPRRLHRKDQTKFTRRYGNLSFITTSGHDRDGEPIGLPSGSIARKLFISLIDKAHRTQSPIVDFQSVYGLLKEVGLTIQTNNRRKVYEQFTRLSTCRVEIYWTPSNVETDKHIRFQGSMFDFAEMYEVYDKNQLLLIPNRVVFTDRFFGSIVQRSSFGYLTELLRKTGSPLEIDILLWLVRRVAFTDTGATIPLERLKEQFFSKSLSNYDFQRWFVPALDNVAGLLGLEYQLKQEEWQPQADLVLPPLTPAQKSRWFRYNPVRQIGV